jgi:hypothetical protein
VKYIIGVLIALAIFILALGAVSAVNVVVVDTPPYTGTLKVEPLPTQPSLKVVNGESIVNADGSVVWQPAGTINQ